MKNLLTLIFTFLFIIANSKAQDWAPLGSTWTYSLETLNPNYLSYSTIESLDTALVDGQLCMEMQIIERWAPSLNDTSSLFMYSDSSKVYFYNDTSWCLLYDFNLQLGDSFELPCILNFQNQPLSGVVEQVDSVYINGANKRSLFLNAPDLISDFTGWTIEGIGHLNYMFPLGDGDFWRSLRCYEDTLGLFKVDTSLNQCDTVILTSIGPISPEIEFELYPNPVRDYITITTDITGYFNIELYNTVNQLISTFSCASHCQLNLSKIQSGVYLLIISDSKNKSIYHKITKL